LPEAGDRFAVVHLLSSTIIMRWIFPKFC
jgi:hypothetical protein